jgi:hypothetical protein
MSRRANPLPPAVRDLVHHASESLDLTLEIWEPGGRAPERLTVGSRCAECEQANPRLFDRCRKRRTYLARREAPEAQPLCEKCPIKLRLACAGGDSAGDPVLFAFGYPAADGDPAPDRRVQSFLHDVQRLLSENRAAQLELHQITDELSSRYEEISLLYSISGKLSRADDLRTTVVNVLAEWRNVLQADCAFLWLRDPTRMEFSFGPHEPPGAHGEGRPTWEHFARRLADSLDNSGEEAHLESLGTQHPIARLLRRETDCIAVAVRSEGRLRGVVCGLRPARHPDFGTPEVRLLQSLAAQLGLALTNADLYEDLKSFLTNTVKTLVAAIDAKDSYTAGHSERVNIVSMLLGNEMNLELQELEALYWGSLLHDVGKIGMPESILNKPGQLDDTEIEIVKQHPSRGWEMLHAIDKLRGAADGVRLHHERWDGKGYPLGLAGEDIPRIARIIAVADTFDAIISNRSYRKGQSAARALEIIDSVSGSQFDPAVVETLRRLLPLLDKHQWILMSGQKGR